MNDNKTVVKILNSYEKREPTDVEKLKKLEGKVRRPADIFAYAFGSVGVLVFGTGMCLAMKAIGAGLHTAVGIAVGVAGMGLCIANYFIRRAILKKRKAKYCGQVLELCGRAMNKENEHCTQSE